MLTQQEAKTVSFPKGLGLDDLARLQWQQFEHDEKFHREIARLPVQDRLKHMVLHFAKYAGRLAEGPGDAEMQRLVTDIFVISVSSANILNIKLSDHYSIFTSGPHARNFPSSITVSAGRMAAACEKMDHLEAYPFREKISEAVLDLMTASVSYAEARGWDLKNLVNQRLQPIKEKSIFYGQI